MNKQNTIQKTGFEIPSMEIRRFECEDIITTSVIGDEDQGEWDPQ